MNTQSVLGDSFIQHFIVIHDPRVQGRCKYALVEILFISVAAVLCGCTSYVDIAEFAMVREEWFRKYLKLPAGVPSHDTIARVFSILDIQALQDAFFRWVDEIASSLGKQICIDGKVIRGSCREFQGSKTLQVVSVYATELGLCLRQEPAPGRGTRESDAALKLLESLQLKGTLVSADAGLASRRVTRKIRERAGDYLVPIKGNQRWSLRELEEFFSQKRKTDTAFQKGKSHGRLEQRKVELRSAETLSTSFKIQWQDVKSVIKITRKRTLKDNRYVLQKTDSHGSHYEKNTQSYKTSEETVYYVTSKKMTAEQAMQSIRNHWKIENHLHWSLDVIFLEDQWRVRQKAAATSLSLIRRLAYNLVKKNPQKGSVRLKLKRAGWKEEFLEELLFKRF